MSNSFSSGGIQMIHNQSALQSQLEMGMKLENPQFDMKSLIKLDLSVDLSMIQTAIAYLFKTCAFHDREFVEMRQQFNAQEKMVIKSQESNQSYQIKQNYLCNKLLGKTRRSPSPSRTGDQFKQTQSFNLEIIKEPSQLGSNLRDIKANRNTQDLSAMINNDEILSQHTGKLDMINDLQDQVNLVNDKVNELSTKLKTATIGQLKVAEGSELLDMVEKLRQEFDSKYIRKLHLRNLSKNEIQVLENDNFNDLMQCLTNDVNSLKVEILDKANQDDLDNLVLAINGNDFAFASDSMLSSPAVEQSNTNNVSQIKNSENKSQTNIYVNDPRQVDGTLKINANTKGIKATTIGQTPSKIQGNQIILPIAPEEKNRAKQIIIGGGNKDSKQLRDLQNRMINLEKLIDNSKIDQARSNIENLKEMFIDLQSTVEKKASVLDNKKLAAVVEEVNIRITETLVQLAEFRTCDLFLGEKGKQSAINMRSIENRQDNFETAFKKLQQQHTDLSFKLNDSIKLLMIGGGKNGDTESQLDERLSKEIKDKTDIAVSEVVKLRDQLLKAFTNLENKVGDKATREDLTQLDDHLSRGMDQIVSNCNKIYVRKTDFNRLSKDIDLQIRSLQEYTFKGASRSNNNRSASSTSPRQEGTGTQTLLNDNEVILATKPLGGWSCGSCGIGLQSIPNMPTGDYNVWTKLPQNSHRLSVQANQKSFQNRLSHKNSVSVDIKDGNNFSVKQLLSKKQNQIDLSKLIGGGAGTGPMTERARINSPYRNLDGPFNATSGGDLDNLITGFTSQQMTIREERPSSTKSLSNQKTSNASLPKIILQKQNKQKIKL
ncbi:UNKNOWN [Stylonychia lemnae]|uniref:Uncharacterized protein n=1 Tax=Stylonychia lemnae TaxID=5949 RepID=A0A078BBD8_STYLE|nr:UNKNOWN [Stylonychia lemnae]|eukprot:CDW91516.1 UNKNOWN [Stylonychia lemnae]